MSTSRSSGGGGSAPWSFPSMLNDVAARFGGLRVSLPSGSGPVSMPEPKIWTPPTATDDENPLPDLPSMPSFPSLPGSLPDLAPRPHPRLRPPHIADRPNPYDRLTTPQSTPPPPLCPPSPELLSNPWGERPPMSPHARSHPPPSRRPGFSPSMTPSNPSLKVSPPSDGPLFSKHEPSNKPTASKPSRHSGPPAPQLPDNYLTPPSPTRPRASSEPPSTQCNGLTKAGNRCTRLVKSPHPYILATRAADDEIERFCYQHIKDILASSGAYLRTGERKWFEFDDWIPPYLSADTKVALRAEMYQLPSVADEPGYIYCYEIRDPKTPNQVHLKVGRTVKLVKRLDEWGKQCGSKEVVLRGWWPGSVNDDGGAGRSLLRGRIQAGEKGRYCHRLERLIHLELSDLMTHEAYLTPGFLRASKEPQKSSLTPSPSPKTSAKKLSRKKCADCGTMHKEIFTFKRVSNGPLKGHEWDRVVQPVIERWGRFVEEMI